MKHAYRHFACLLGFLLLAFCLQGQDGQNPFDLQHRQKKTEQAATSQLPQSDRNPFELERETPQPSTEQAVPSPEANPFEMEKGVSSQATSPSEAEQANPFEVDRGQQLAVSDRPVEAEANPFELSRKERLLQEIRGAQPEVEEAVAAATAVPISPVSKNFSFWVTLTLLLLLAILATLYRNILLKVYRSFTNDNFLKLVHREQAGFLGFPYILLYVFFFINAGVFVFYAADHFGLRDYQHQAGSLFRYIGWVAGIFIGKQLLLRFLGEIFPITKEIRQYSFMITIFSIAIGLLLLPINIMAAHASDPLPGMALISGGVIVLLVYLFRVVRSLFLASRYLSMNKFHFFMYLCTVEIAPVLVLLKLVLMKTGGIQ
ncbi:MAG: DUF4271 domain-containing protein [Bacteroidota bacterium]